MLEEFLRNEKNDKREVHTMGPAELNKYLVEFIRSVRRKDREDYEPSSLIYKMSCFKCWEAFEENNYPVSTGVPDGAARQKTRSTGWNWAGWES